MPFTIVRCFVYIVLLYDIGTVFEKFTQFVFSIYSFFFRTNFLAGSFLDFGNFFFFILFVSVTYFCMFMFTKFLFSD